MMILILLTKMIGCSGILFGYYWLFLRNKKFHHYNRFYLLAATASSIIIPFLKIPVFVKQDTPTGEIINRSLDIISANRWEDDFGETPGAGLFESWFTIQIALPVLYGLIVLILLCKLGRSLFYIYKLSKKYSYEYINTLKFYSTTEPGTPFSFFRSIFWNSRLNFHSHEGQQIFKHELFHVKQRHSADILFLECISTLFWFNPVFHLIKKEIKAIHEFLADQHAVSDNNQHNYAELLILQSIYTKRSTISNYFFQNHIKRRIAMITQFKNKKYSYWTRVMILPVSIFLFCAVALYAQHPKKAASDAKTENIQATSNSEIRQESRESKAASKETENGKLLTHRIDESVTVLIDAGHGGNDAGAISRDGKIKEKDLALAIALQIKKFAQGYNIKAVMTREDDVYPGIKDRTEMAVRIKADLIISVHIAATEQNDNAQRDDFITGNGVEIFVTGKNQKTLEKSKILGTQIANRIHPYYTVDAIKQRKEKGIWILDAAPCPAVLIECGYLTDEKDLAFISKTENQARIAKSILEGIVDYQYRDTIPSDTRDEEKTKLKQAKDQRGPARVMDADMQNEHRVLLKKQQEMELAQQKLAKARYADMQNEQRMLLQKQQNIELAQHKLAKARYADIQNEQRMLLQKQQNIELAQHKLAKARYADTQNEQRMLLQKQQDMELSQRKSIAAANADMALARRKYIEAGNAQIQNEQKILLQKQQRIELAQQNKDMAEGNDDKLVKERKEPVFARVEIEPEYPGGDGAWKNYLDNHIRYPFEAKSKNISGIVVVQFIVDKEGNISEALAIDGPEELRAEAERLITQSGKWSTARQNGQIVKAYSTKTINFTPGSK